MTQLLSSHRFVEGAVLSVPLLDDRLRETFALGSRNQLLLGMGNARPWGGLLSKGAGTGARKMLQVGKTWGGIKDIGGLQGSGSFFEDIGRSLWSIGAGQPSIEGTNLTGITLSTILQVSIAVAGVYSAGNTFAAGLPQPSTPDVAIRDAPGAGYEGLTTGPVSFKIARLRLTTGGRSVASPTSAVLVPSAKTIRLTFPLASTGQTHWRVFATQEGFGGVGLHYALKYGVGAAAVLDIPESVVAASTIDGVGRSLEFDYHTGDLVPEIAYIDDYPPPAGTHAVRLENVMVVLGAFADSSTAVSSTNPGTVGACSLPNFYESYKPSHRLYFPEQIVDHRARPTDSYCYVAHRNSISALQYVGLRDGPAVAVTTILPDVGIARQQNWCQVGGLLYMRLAKGGFARMKPDGSLDYGWAAPIWDSVKAWDDSTVVGWHPDTMSVVISNGTEAWSYCLLNETWSPCCYLQDAGITGTVLSCANSQGELIVTVNNAGAHTAYSWDKGAATMPISSITPWRRASPPVSVREVHVAFENDRTADPLLIAVFRNLRPTFLRDVALANGNNVVTSASAPFDVNRSGERFCAFAPGIGPGGANYLLGRMVYIAPTQVALYDIATGAALTAFATRAGVYAWLAHDMVVYPFTRKGAQHSEFLKEFFTLDAQSYALGFGMLTDINAGDSALSRGQIISAEVIGSMRGAWGSAKTI